MTGLTPCNYTITSLTSTVRFWIRVCRGFAAKFSRSFPTSFTFRTARYSLNHLTGLTPCNYTITSLTSTVRFWIRVCRGFAAKFSRSFPTSFTFRTARYSLNHLTGLTPCNYTITSLTSTVRFWIRVCRGFAAKFSRSFPTSFTFRTARYSLNHLTGLTPCNYTITSLTSTVRFWIRVCRGFAAKFSRSFPTSFTFRTARYSLNHLTGLTPCNYTITSLTSTVRFWIRVCRGFAAKFSRSFPTSFTFRTARYSLNHLTGLTPCNYTITSLTSTVRFWIRVCRGFAAKFSRSFPTSFTFRTARYSLNHLTGLTPCNYTITSLTSTVRFWIRVCRGFAAKFSRSFPTSFTFRTARYSLNHLTGLTPCNYTITSLTSTVRFWIRVCRGFAAKFSRSFPTSFTFRTARYSLNHLTGLTPCNYTITSLTSTVRFWIRVCRGFAAKFSRSFPTSFTFRTARYSLNHLTGLTPCNYTITSLTSTVRFWIRVCRGFAAKFSRSFPTSFTFRTARYSLNHLTGLTPCNYTITSLTSTVRFWIRVCRGFAAKFSRSFPTSFTFRTARYSLNHLTGLTPCNYTITSLTSTVRFWIRVCRGFAAKFSRSFPTSFTFRTARYSLNHLTGLTPCNYTITSLTSTVRFWIRVCRGFAAKFSRSFPTSFTFRTARYSLNHLTGLTPCNYTITSLTSTVRFWIRVCRGFAAKFSRSFPTSFTFRTARYSLNHLTGLTPCNYTITSLTSTVRFWIRVCRGFAAKFSRSFPTSFTFRTARYSLNHLTGLTPCNYTITSLTSTVRFWIRVCRGFAAKFSRSFPTSFTFRTARYSLNHLTGLTPCNYTITSLTSTVRFWIRVCRGFAAKFSRSFPTSFTFRTARYSLNHLTGLTPCNYTITSLTSTVRFWIRVCRGFAAKFSRSFPTSFTFRTARYSLNHLTGLTPCNYTITSLTSTVRFWIRVCRGFAAKFSRSFPTSFTFRTARYSLNHLTGLTPCNYTITSLTSTVRFWIRVCRGFAAKFSRSFPTSFTFRTARYSLNHLTGLTPCNYTITSLTSTVRFWIRVCRGFAAKFSRSFPTSFTFRTARYSLNHLTGLTPCNYTITSLTSTVRFWIRVCRGFAAKFSRSFPTSFTFRTARYSLNHLTGLTPCNYTITSLTSTVRFWIRVCRGFAAKFSRSFPTSFTFRTARYSLNHLTGLTPVIIPSQA